MDNLIMAVIENLLMIIVAVVASYAVALIRKRLGVEGMQKFEIELALKQELAVIAVRFVEQAFRDFKGDEKYNMAADWISDRASEKGIKITPAETKGLIEAALRAFRDEFGESWSKEVV